MEPLLPTLLNAQLILAAAGMVTAMPQKIPVLMYQPAQARYQRGAGMDALQLMLPVTHSHHQPVPLHCCVLMDHVEVTKLKNVIPSMDVL
jgi:hypothetical protein